MGRTFDDARRWMQQGTKLLQSGVATLDESGFNEPSTLPDWTRKHLLAHVASNAEALGNLVRWAATGIETPMYASSDARADGIERGQDMSGPDLVGWLSSSAATLERAMKQLSTDQWSHPVVTAQGRTVPATEIPWLRAREVCVHAVDLDDGITFDNLPDDFLHALCQDIRNKRGDVPVIDGPLAEQAAWLAGRPHSLAEAPDHGPWL
jgi:maleylpyruvate isomerase